MYTHSVTVLLNMGAGEQRISLEITGPLALPDNTTSVQLLNAWAETEYQLGQTIVPWSCIMHYPGNQSTVTVQGETLQIILRNIAYCLATFYKAEYESAALIVTKAIMSSDGGYWGVTYTPESFDGMAHHAKPVHE